MYVSVKEGRLQALLLSAGGVMALMLFPAACTKGILKGLEYTAQILIPSLFPYMFISAFIMRSGVSELIGKLSACPVKALFGLPPCCAGAVILSFIGGFPVGAKCVQILYDSGRITAPEARKMMNFCVCSGPAFLITAIGCVMLGNPVSGVILYISQLSSGLIIGIVCSLSERLSGKAEKTHNINQKSITSGEKSFVSCLTDSCADASYSMLCMTGLVALFCLLQSVCDYSGFSGMFSSAVQFFGVEKRMSGIILPGLLEVTSGSRAVFDNSCPLWCFAAVTGFGGLCVHFQIFAVLRNVPIKRSIYLCFRAANSILSALICFVICCFYVPDEDAVSVFGGYEFIPSASTAAGSTAVLMLCLLFVLSIRKGSGKIRI